MVDPGDSREGVGGVTFQGSLFRERGAQVEDVQREERNDKEQLEPDERVLRLVLSFLLG